MVKTTGDGVLADLVAGSRLRFEACGAHELRGVPGRWELYAVAG